MGTKTFEIINELSYDVIVVGGGTTGIAAAIASARQGKKTLLVEYYGALGGNSTSIPAWIGFHDANGNLVVGGIALEMIKKLREVDAATDFYMDPICSSAVGINTHWWKIIAMRECRKAGVHVLLHSSVVDIETDSSDDITRIKGVFIRNSLGLSYFSAKVVVDCTDSGNIAKKSGIKMVRGRSGDNKVQVSSWTVTFGNINFEKLLNYFKENPTEIRPFVLDNPEGLLKQMEKAEIFVMGSFKSLIQKAKADGVDVARDFMPGIAFPGKNYITSVGSRVENVDPLDTWNLTKAEETGMAQIEIWIKFLRQYVPGCEECLLQDSPTQIGIRESNHMIGEYVLTAEDLMQAKQFDDVIALGGYHLDIHSPDHLGLETQKAPAYQIPYRCLFSKKVENLLVAGRAISATHEAYSSTRVIPISMAQGQAAGLAAAMAAAQDCRVYDVPIDQLQAQLRNDKAILECEGPSLEFIS